MSYERIHMTPIRTRIKAFTRARFINVIINVIFTRKGCHLVSFINGASSLILPLNTVIKVENNLWGNLAYIKPQDEVKFVLCSRDDYEWAKTLLSTHKINEKCPVLFSPVYGQVNPTALAEWVLADKLPVRMQVQLHKILWGEKPGV